MNIDVREYLRINPISVHDLTLSDLGTDCFLYFSPNNGEYQVYTQDKMFESFYSIIFNDLVTIDQSTGKFRLNYENIVPNITWSESIRLSNEQFKDYVRRNRLTTDSSTFPNIGICSEYMEWFDQQVIDLENNINKKLDDLRKSAILDYAGGTELMSKLVSIYDQGFSYAKGHIWCLDASNQPAIGYDYIGLTDTISHTHDNTRAETMTTSFSSKFGGGQVVDKFKVGSKQLVASNSYPISTKVVPVKIVNESGLLSYPLGGLNILDWRNPSRTHNNMPPSFNIYIKYRNATISTTSNRSMDANDCMSTKVVSDESYDDFSLIDHETKLSVVEAQYESKMVNELNTYETTSLTDHDFILRTCLNRDNSIGLYKQTIQMLLDIFVGVGSRELGVQLVQRDNGSWVSEDEYNEGKAIEQQIRKFIPMNELLQSYFDQELVPFNEFIQWHNKKIDKFKELANKIALINELIVSIKPLSYVGRIIVSTKDDIESKVIKNYGGKSWKRLLNFPRGVDNYGNQNKPHEQLGLRFGEEFVCLRESNIPNHRHDVKIVKDKDAQTNQVVDDTLGEHDWICTGRGGIEPKMLNQTYAGTSNKVGGLSNVQLEYQVSPLEYQKKATITIPHDNIPPHREVYIWECIEVTPDEGGYVPINTYRITYDMNGHGTRPTTAWTTYHTNSPLPYSPPSATAIGYTFKGWTPTSIPKGSTGDKTFTARWDINTYTITWDVNGGVKPSQWNSTRTIKYGEAVGAFPTPSPTKTDNDFAGWFTSKDGGTQVKTTDTITNNVTFYAHWKSTKANVTFDAQGGTSVASRTLDIGSKIGSLPTTTRTGYTFANWWTSSTSGTQVTTNTIVNNDVTFYAHWNAITYTVKLIDGTSIQEIKVKYNEQVGTLPTPKKTGYSFKGWFSTTNGGTKLEPTTRITSDVTFYSNWQIETYSITYVMNGHGTIPSNAKTSYTVVDDTYVPPTPASVANWKFLGWNPTQLTKGSTGNKTFTANWEKETITITFDRNY